MSSAEDHRLEAEVRELVCYLWDNYLQLYDAQEIFIIGVGYAYIGIKMLLLNRSEASPPGKFFLSHVEQPHCSAFLLPLCLAPLTFTCLDRLQDQALGRHQLCQWVLTAH